MTTNHNIILVVDDNSLSRYTTVKILQHHGFTVLEAASGNDALEQVRTKKPNLVLLDLQLPDINGYEVCRIIKSDPQTRDIIVVYLTSLYLTVEHKAQGLDSGADADLTHAVEPLELISTIQALLRFQAHERLRNEEAQQWIILFNALNDAVLLLDPEGRIVRYNQAFQRLVAKPESEIRGKHCFELVHDDKQPPADCPLQGTKQTLQHALVDLQFGNRWFEIHVDPIFSTDKDVLGFAYVMNDITLRKTLHQELERRVEERTVQLKMANQELEDFTHTISHDLKAPIRRIRDYLSLLEPEVIQSAPLVLQQTLANIEKNVTASLTLIDGLQRLAHLEELVISKEHINMIELVKSVYETTATEDQKTHISFIIGDLPVCYGDPILVRQLWQNLISNAIKYSSKQPEPTITITAEETEGSVLYCIADNGIGFDMKYSDKLFTMFGRLHRDQDYEGLGIGLALCRKIIQRHGGTIWAESTPGEGSRFYISFPLEITRSLT